MRDIAVHLSEAVSTDPPPSLRASVLAQIAQTPQNAPQERAEAQRYDDRAGQPATTQANVTPLRRRSRATWATGLVAAAALVAAIALGGWAISSRNDAHEATAQTQELTQLLSSPDVKTASGSFATAGSGTVIVSASQGRALLVAGGLPALPSGKVYEAWTLTKAPVPAGTFTPSGSQTLVSLPSRAVTSSGVAITVEPDGGSPHPTTKPIFAVNLPKA